VVARPPLLLCKDMPDTPAQKNALAAARQKPHPVSHDVFSSNLHRRLRHCDDGQTCTLARVGLATMDPR